MSYTFTEAEQEVRDMLGGRSTTIQARTTKWLRDAYLMLLTSTHARYFYDVQQKSNSHIIGAKLIDNSEVLISWTSDDILAISAIQDVTNNKIIDEKNFQTIISQAVDADAIPTKYYRWEDTLYFNTTAASSDNQPTTILWYIQRPPTWAGGDEPNVPEEWQVTLVYKAVEIGWIALQNTEKRKEMRELLTNTIRGIIHPREFQDDQIEWGMVPSRGPRSAEGLFHRTD